MEIIVSEKLKEKRLHKSVQSLGDVWDTSKLSNICIGRAPAGEENVFGHGQNAGVRRQEFITSIWQGPMKKDKNERKKNLVQFCKD